MATKKIDKLERQLRERYKVLQVKMSSSMADMPTNDGGDVADYAFVADSSHVRSRSMENSSRELGQIALALEKIATGTYGACEGCDKTIGAERLEALPFSAYCVGCQRQRELAGNTDDDDRAATAADNDDD